MRKNALIICTFTCAFGAIGAFCRWLQVQIAFDEAGLSVSSMWNYIVPIVLIAAAVCFYAFVSKYRRAGLTMTADFYDTFQGSTKFFVPGAWILGAMMIFGGMVLIATLPDTLNKVLYRVLAGLAVLTGIAFPLTATGSQKRFEPGVNSLFATFPVLLFCLWLITSYKQNSTNPTVWAYAVEILALAAALLAFFYFAGYPYGRPRPGKSLYFSMLGSFLCIVALADDRNFGLQLMLVAAAGMQLFWAWMIVSNMYKPEEKPAETAEDAAVPTVNVDRIIDEFHDEEQQ